MSRHWNPDEELADRELVRRLAAEELARARRRPWPEGATAGLALIALSCAAFGAILYQVAGPRVVVDNDAARR